MGNERAHAVREGGVAPRLPANAALDAKVAWLRRHRARANKANAAVVRELARSVCTLAVYEG